MARNHPHIPFERYADDAICHCASAEEARALWSALVDRFAACKLALHPEKTKIVYCKDANRRGEFSNIHFDFLGFQFRARKTIWNGKPAHGFMPAASPKALTSISRTIRRWALHHRSEKSLKDLAEIYNPCIRGWIAYYGNFYKTQFRPTLTRIAAVRDSLVGRETGLLQDPAVPPLLEDTVTAENAVRIEISDAG
jgi:RNA-directed DNA polymerase